MSDPGITDLVSQAMAKEWFYSYPMPGGGRTPTYGQGELDAIHDTRWGMLQQYLHSVFSGQYEHLKAVDLASHQGYFAVKTAQLGFSSVLGIEARQSHIDDSRLIADIYGLQQLSFQQADIHDVDTQQVGQFDLVMMLGLLYHLENPIGVGGAHGKG